MLFGVLFEDLLEFVFVLLVLVLVDLVLVLLDFCSLLLVELLSLGSLFSFCSTFSFIISFYSSYKNNSLLFNIIPNISIIVNNNKNIIMCHKKVP